MKNLLNMITKNKSLCQIIFCHFNFQKRLWLIIILIVLCFYMPDIFSQQSSPFYQWVRNAGSTNYDEGFDVARDNLDNIIVTGYADSISNFGGMIVPNFGSSDIIVAKYDSAGQIIWARNAGGEFDDRGYSVITDHENNIIVTGYFNESAVFDTISVLADGIQDAFVAKYDPNGNIQWVQHAGGGKYFNSGYRVAVDNQDNILVTGQIYGQVIFAGTSINAGYTDGMFAAKFDKFGNLLWVNSAGSVGFNDYGYGIASDKNDNVFVCGGFGDVTAIGDTTITSLGGSDIFLAKYDPDGNFNWVRQAGGSFYNDIAWDLKVDDNGMIYFTGGFGSTASFDNIMLTSVGYEDIFIAKYNSSGFPIWVKQEGLTNVNYGTGLTLDKGNNITIIGGYDQPIDSDPNQESEIYLGRYNSDGMKSWQSLVNSSNYSYSGGVKSLTNGDLVFNGSFSGTAVFGTLYLNGFGSQDIFTGRMQAPHLITQHLLELPDIQIGGTISSSVTISNQSQTTLYIRNYRITGMDSVNFSVISNTLIDSLNGMQNSNIGVSFSSQNPGTKQALLIIYSDSPSNPDTVFLQGNSLTSIISLSADTLNFGTVDLNNSSHKNLTITNLNSAGNLIINLNITGNNSSEFSSSVLMDTLPPLGVQNVNVSFTPVSSGSKNAMLNVYDTSNVLLGSVTLMGEGIQSIVVQYGDTATLDHNTLLNVNPPSGFIPTSNKLFYRKAGYLSYHQDELFQTETTYVGVIPAIYSTVAGVEFYVVFYSGTDSVTFPSSDPINKPQSVVLKVPSYLYPASVNKSAYQMISIPLNVSNPNIISVLSDYGRYDSRIWRIFRWQPNLNNYLEYPYLGNKFLPGNAFWLIRRDGSKFTIRNASTVYSGNIYPIIIQPGWNQIGDPFAFPVSWDSISNSEQLQSPIHWNASIQDYEINQMILQPWDGYWVYNSGSEDVTILVPPVADFSTPKLNQVPDLKKDEFYIQLEANLKNSGIVDQQNFIGMFEQTGSGPDNKNVLEPPPISDKLNVSIVKNDKKYAQNITPVSTEGAYWDLTVASNNDNRDVVIRLNNKSTLPESFEIWFFDLDRQTAIPITNNILEFQLPSNGFKNCRIIVGKEDYAKSHSANIPLVPLEYALFQNYPNPFNPTTNIVYQLKEKSNVTVEIFDILGRRIAALINNQIQSPGRYTISWNGENSHGSKVSTGVYLYRIRANRFVDTKKMILLR